MLEVTDHGRIRELRLDRAPANALSPDMVVLLREKLVEAGAKADAIVISGRPGMFSAGLDVPALLREDRQGIARFWQSFGDLLYAIASAPVPVAFALTGHCPAGGIVLSLYGDYRIMAGGNFKTGLNEVQVGLVVSPVISRALVRLIGPHPAEKILVSGQLLSPDQALEIGLIDEVEEDPEATVSRAIAWCEQMLTLPRHSMLATRQLCRNDLVGLFEQQENVGVEAFLDLWFSDGTQSTLQALVARLQKK